ncbi:MAG: tetratricopeptide repeat protein [Chloroflexi bacterium]|nr:tetratricopeptide repeat protein [Chloroflexota bacterium]
MDFLQPDSANHKRSRRTLFLARLGIAMLVVWGLVACNSSATAPPSPVPAAVQTTAAGQLQAGKDALKGGKTSEAIQQLEQAVTTNPESVEALFNLGNAYMDAEQFDKAIASFQSVLALEPKHADARSNLGVAYYRKGDMKQAVEAFQKAVELSPQDAEIQYNLGGSLAQMNRLDEAIAAFQKALELDPNLPEAYLGLGSVFKLQGKNKEAIDALNRFLELSDNPQWRAHAQQLLSELQGK